MPLSVASAADLSAIFSVCCALSAFCLIVAFISSTDDDASSAAAACSVFPCDNCSAPEDNCWLPAVTFFAAVLTSVATLRSFSTIAERDFPSLSFSERTLTVSITSPFEIISATWA